MTLPRYGRERYRRHDNLVVSFNQKLKNKNKNNNEIYLESV